MRLSKRLFPFWHGVFIVVSACLKGKITDLLSWCFKNAHATYLFKKCAWFLTSSSFSHRLCCHHLLMFFFFLTCSYPHLSKLWPFKTHTRGWIQTLIGQNMTSSRAEMNAWPCNYEPVLNTLLVINIWAFKCKHTVCLLWVILLNSF